MSWPLFFAQTPAAPVTPAAPAPPAPPEAPATPAAPVEAPATPAAPTTPPVLEVPVDALGTPAQPVTDMTPTVVQPDAAASGKYEAISTSTLNMGHWTVLIMFAGVCLGLIATVMFSTSKSDVGGGIMGGGGASAASFKGKKSGEEKLSALTSWFATAFIVMSLAMTFMFR